MSARGQRLVHLQMTGLRRADGSRSGLSPGPHLYAKSRGSGADTSLPSGRRFKRLPSVWPSSSLCGYASVERPGPFLAEDRAVDVLIQSAGGLQASTVCVLLDAVVLCVCGLAGQLPMTLRPSSSVVSTLLLPSPLSYFPHLFWTNCPFIWVSLHLTQKLYYNTYHPINYLQNIVLGSVHLSALRMKPYLIYFHIPKTWDSVRDIVDTL